MEKWYEEMELEDICISIQNEISATCASFVAIGYFLKQVRDRELYLQTGYKDIWEFAQVQFGISKSSASRFMNINDHFSIGGNSPELLEQYEKFSSSQLSEMLTLTDGQMEQVTVETTVKEIRAMKPKKEKKCDAKAINGTCSDCFYYKDVGCPFPKEKELLKCKENPDYVCGIVKVIEEHFLVKGNTEGCVGCCRFCLKKEKCEYVCDCVKDNEINNPLDDYYQLAEPFECSDCMLNNNPDGGILECHPEIGEHKCFMSEDEDRAEEENSVATSQQMSEPEGQDAIHEDDPEYFNLRDVQVFLDKANQRLQECRQRPGMNPEAHRHQAIDVAAYSLLVDSLQDTTAEIKQMIQTAVRYYNLNDYGSADFYLYQARRILYETKELAQSPIKPEVNELPSKQPELPVLRNNEKRGAFIGGFEEWPVWIECKETGERYWRYQMDKDIAIVVKGNQRHLWISDKRKRSTTETEYAGYEYYLLGVEIKYGKKGYEFKRNPHKTFFESVTNRSALIDFLKQYQKGGVTG
ncbi:MAG: hypothetical protein NC089_09365 [Bacteroides sp.]|nr:hypothetical protein [Bacteroides sp.]MCM1549635.1 hypothetical protein [Clostridium sp.]